MNKKHGHTSKVKKKGRWVQVKSPTYNSWECMNRRCYDEGHQYYYLYGERGIDVCERWRRGTPGAFRNFLEDMGERPRRSMTLDRKDANLGYFKNNCRWADKLTQNANRRTTFMIDVEPINSVPF
jgi:hypothetical protein